MAKVLMVNCVFVLDQWSWMGLEQPLQKDGYVLLCSVPAPCNGVYCR